MRRQSDAMRPCLNQSCFPTLTAVEFLRVAAAAGVRSVELRTLDRAEPLPAIRAAVREASLRVEAVNALMDWAQPDDPDPRPQLERLLEVAHAVEAPLLVCVAPIRTAGLPPTGQVIQSTSERLATLAGLAGRAGVRLAFEQVGKSSSRPGARSGIRRLVDTVAVVEQAGPEALLAMDSYNLATAGEDYAAIRSIPPERIGIAHLVDRDAETGFRTVPGDGDLPLADFVAILREAGYSGALSVETFPSDPWPDPVSFARQAIERVNQYIARRTT
jgi:sugar phosphate isomerase/epimerase